MVKYYEEKDMVVLSQIEEVAKVLKQYKIDSPSIYMGNAGISLFYYYYYKLTNEVEYYNLAIDSLSKALNTLIIVHSKNYSFGYGTSGILWVLYFFEKEGFFEKDEIIHFELFDKHLGNAMDKEIKESNFFFMKGATGIGSYFYRRLLNDININKEYLNNFIANLEIIMDSDKTPLGNLHSTRLNNLKQSKESLEFGLSNGVPGIIMLLSKLYYLDISKEKIKTILNRIVKFILSQQLDFTHSNSYFPVRFFDGEDVESTIRWWCGDLSIGIALYNYAIAFNDKEIKNLSIEIFSNSAKRKQLKAEGIFDAGIFRGTCGVVALYNRMHINTGIDLFKESADYWMNETIKMSKFEDGFAGYKAWRSKSHGYVNSIGLLDGVAGIGLTMISHLDKSLIDWDESILLS